MRFSVNPDIFPRFCPDLPPIPEAISDLLHECLPDDIHHVATGLNDNQFNELIRPQPANLFTESKLI